MTRKDYELIMRITDRYEKTCTRAGIKKPLNIVSLRMDMDFINDQTPLDFEKLANFNDQDFLHDITGILNHFNRSTKTMDDCFLPRCAK